MPAVTKMMATPVIGSGCAGGSRQGDRGYFLEPTVVVDLQQDDEMIQNEIFGPVITVQRFSDEAEAIEKANGVDYALASSVWTENHGRAMRMAKALDFGTDLSMYGFEDYTRIKHVMSSIEE